MLAFCSSAIASGSSRLRSLINSARPSGCATVSCLLRQTKTRELASAFVPNAIIRPGFSVRMGQVPTTAYPALITACRKVAHPVELIPSCAISLWLKVVVNRRRVIVRRMSRHASDGLRHSVEEKGLRSFLTTMPIGCCDKFLRFWSCQNSKQLRVDVTKRSLHPAKEKVRKVCIGNVIVVGWISRNNSMWWEYRLSEHHIDQLCLRQQGKMHLVISAPTRWMHLSNFRCYC